MKTTFLTILGAAWLAGAVAGQAEKMTISIAPRPGQKIHFIVTETSAIEGSAQGGDAENQPPRRSSKLAGMLMTAYNLVTERLDDRGRTTGTLTFERGRVELNVAGSPPMKDDDTLRHGIGGKTYSLVLGTNGEVTDVTAQDARPEVLAAVKVAIAEVHQYFPTVSLAVGERVAQPLAAVLPRQLVPRVPFDIDGRAAVTLVSLEGTGADRIAHCHQSYELTMSVPPHPDQRGGKYSIRKTIRGRRQVQVNVDRGIVIASEMETTFDVTETPVSATLPTFTLHGALRATVAGTY